MRQQVCQCPKIDKPNKSYFLIFFFSSFVTHFEINSPFRGAINRNLYPPRPTSFDRRVTLKCLALTLCSVCLAESQSAPPPLQEQEHQVQRVGSAVRLPPGLQRLEPLHSADGKRRLLMSAVHLLNVNESQIRSFPLSGRIHPASQQPLGELPTCTPQVEETHSN